MRPRRRWIRRGGVWRMLRLGAVVSRERSASGRGRDGHEGGRADVRVGRDRGVNSHTCGCSLRLQRALCPLPPRFASAARLCRLCLCDRVPWGHRDVPEMCVGTPSFQQQFNSSASGGKVGPSCVLIR